MSDYMYSFEARPLDDPDTVERLQGMIAAVRAAHESGSPYEDEMIKELMKETRKAIRRGLLEGSDEIMDAFEDKFYEEDELE